MGTREAIVAYDTRMGDGYSSRRILYGLGVLLVWRLDFCDGRTCGRAEAIRKEGFVEKDLKGCAHCQWLESIYLTLRRERDQAGRVEMSPAQERRLRLRHYHAMSVERPTPKPVTNTVTSRSDVSCSLPMTGICGCSAGGGVDGPASPMMTQSNDWNAARPVSAMSARHVVETKRKIQMCERSVSTSRNDGEVDGSTDRFRGLVLSTPTDSISPTNPSSQAWWGASRSPTSLSLCLTRLGFETRLFGETCG